MILTEAAEALLTHAPLHVKKQWAYKLNWTAIRHHYQRPPEGEWRGWMMQGGRGIGKTLTGADDVLQYAADYPGLRYGIIAPTLGDARDICVEGETGVLAVAEQMGIRLDWNRSLLEGELPNGSHFKCFSAEKPNRLRGPQHHRLWFEELASFKDAHKGDALQTTFNNAMLGLRLAAKPGWHQFPGTQYVVTTTPRRVKLITDLASRDNIVVTRGTTYDNLANLDPGLAHELLRYEGTHLGRQELLGEIIREVPGALWTWNLIDPYRPGAKYGPDELPDPEWVEDHWEYQGISFNRIVVGVDPSGGSDEIGIVVAGKINSPCPCGHQDVRGAHYAVLADETTIGSPEHWGRKVATTFHNYQADKVIAERNFGADMVESTIRTADRHVPVKPIHASRGKDQRAEPVSAVYEQGRVHHLDGFPKLEDEQTSYVKGEDDWSPNRLDGLVWALTELGLESGSTGALRERSVTSLG